MWANDPTRQLVCIASDGDLALRDANRQRDLVKSNWFRGAFAEGWGFSPSQDAKGYFENTRKGFRYSAGLTGSITGWRGHGVIMDDLLQAKDVLSKPARDTAVYALENIIPSRINDMARGFFVMVQQRLCVGDPADWAISQRNYEHLNLPTEFVERKRFKTFITVDVPANGVPAHKARQEFRSDPRTVEGELLFPSMFTPEVVADAKKNPEMFAAQHQQDPMPPGGGMFKVSDWRFWRTDDPNYVPTKRDPLWYQGAAKVKPSKFDKMIVSCDATFGSKSATASRVAFHVWGALGGDRYLLARVWDRMDFDETERAGLSLFKRWPEAREKVIEKAANGPGLVTRWRDIHHIAGIIESPTGVAAKPQRANAMLPYQRGGNVYLPDDAPWLADYITEHALFPGPCHLGDDDVDAQSQGLSHLEEAETGADLITRATWGS